MNLSGVISRVFACYMVKKEPKGCFYPEEIHWRHDASLPLLLLIIALGLGLVWFSRFQKSGKTLITFGWLVLLLLSLQPVADKLLRPIENTYPTAGKPESGVHRGAGRRVYRDPNWAPALT